MTPSEFKEIVDNVEGANWHGAYKGRCYHEGVAFTADSLLAFMGVILAVNEEWGSEAGILLDEPHTDSMGRYSTIYSWDINCFSNDDIPEADDEEDEEDEY